MTKKMNSKTAMIGKMEAFIAERTQGCDIVFPDGEQVFYVAPNRFGQGYIYWFIGDMKWIADLKRNDPKHVARVKQERMTEEQVLSFKQHIFNTLREQRRKEWKTMRWNDFKALNDTLDVTANWLMDHGVEVE